MRTTSMLLLLSFVCTQQHWVESDHPWVEDWAENPILSPSEPGEWLLGDPTVLTLSGRLHMFANEVFIL